MTIHTSSTCRERSTKLASLIKKGGFWNSTPDQAEFGYTKDDVATVKRELKSAGVAMSSDDVDALLMAAVMGYVTVAKAPRKAKGDRKPAASSADRKRAQRARARANGLCLMNPHHGLAGDGFTCCLTCRTIKKGKPC